MLTTHSTTHRRLSTFVDWIRTTKEKKDVISEQANEIRERIAAKAKNDGLTIASMPWSGSYAKRTGLRRYMSGKTPVEGQDVDLPFVVSPNKDEEEDLDYLIPRFEGYAKESYPRTERYTTKSSVKLVFSGTKLSYDIVPMLATSDTRRQILIRSNGDRRLTSVQDHIEFVRRRTKASQSQEGRVQFNDMVRLLKWWREVQSEGDKERFPTIVIDLMCAHAFRMHGTQTTYPATLAAWFGFLAAEVQGRSPIHFDDFCRWSQPFDNAPWQVIDPVNPDNNVAGGLSTTDLSMLGSWLEAARDDVLQAISADIDDEESIAMDALSRVFGMSIVHNT